MLFIKYVEIYARFYALNLNLFWGPRLGRLPLPINYLLYAQARSSEASLSAPCESERTLSAGSERWIWMRMRALSLSLDRKRFNAGAIDDTHPALRSVLKRSTRTQPHLRFPRRTASKAGWCKSSSRFRRRPRPARFIAGAIDDTHTALRPVAQDRAHERSHTCDFH
jgi:hypothetical protein